MNNINEYHLCEIGHTESFISIVPLTPEIDLIKVIK